MSLSHVGHTSIQHVESVCWVPKALVALESSSHLYLQHSCKALPHAIDKVLDIFITELYRHVGLLAMKRPLRFFTATPSCICRSSCCTLASTVIPPPTLMLWVVGRSSSSCFTLPFPLLSAVSGLSLSWFTSEVARLKSSSAQPANGLVKAHPLELPSFNRLHLPTALGSSCGKPLELSLLRCRTLPSSCCRRLLLTSGVASSSCASLSTAASSADAFKAGGTPCQFFHAVNGNGSTAAWSVPAADSTVWLEEIGQTTLCTRRIRATWR